MSKHKTPAVILELALLDGTPQGVIRISSNLLQTLAFRIPRGVVGSEEFQKSLEVFKGLNNPGIYILYGKLEDEEKPIVYVGQVGNRVKDQTTPLFQQRLREHEKNNKKTFVEKIFFFTTKDGLRSTHLDYLENSIYRLILDSGKYIVDNKEEPKPGLIVESDIVALEPFVDWAQVYLSLLGLNLYEEKKPEIDKIVEESVEQKGSPGQFLPGEYRFKSFDAYLLVTGDKFILKKGSVVKYKEHYPKGFNVGSIDQRDEAVEKGDLIEREDGNFILNKDYEFSSPSAALRFITGRKPTDISTDWVKVEQ